MAHPDIIGRYRIERVLGSGGFATVYLADDPHLEDSVAIKVMANNLAGDAGLRERFIKEARLMRQLAAPGLVTVYDIGEHDDAPFFVMEYCPLGTLAERLAAVGRPLTIDEGLALINAISACTGSIHRAGVVHRDIKPSNYLIRQSPTTTTVNYGGVLGPDEELVVADFGLAKIVDAGSTQLSIAGGTPGYSAPEQFRGDASVDASADVYAASAVVTAAISGVQPKPVLAADDAPFDQGALASTGPLAIELARGMSSDKTHRHSDMSAWHSALQIAARQRTGATMHVAPPPSTLRPSGPPPSSPPPSGPPPSGPPPSGFAPSGPLPSLPPNGGAPSTQPNNNWAPPNTWHPPPVSDPGPGTLAEAHTAFAPQTPVPQSAPPSQRGTQPEFQTFPEPAPISVQHPEPDAPVSPRSPRRSRKKLLAVVALIVALGTGAGSLLTGVVSLPGPAIVGPPAGVVGDEAVFAIDGSGRWSVNDVDAADGSSIAVTPASQGAVKIEVSSFLRSTTIVYDVAEPGPLRVEGPGVSRVGEPLELRATGSTGPFTWTVGTEPPVEAETLVLSPESRGAITVRVTSAAGDETTRTFTVLSTES